jgi:hypothetical protein
LFDFFYYNFNRLVLQFITLIIHDYTYLKVRKKYYIYITAANASVAISMHVAIMIITAADQNKTNQTGLVVVHHINKNVVATVTLHCFG